jgi:glycerol uptake facilitator protein
MENPNVDPRPADDPGPEPVAARAPEPAAPREAIPTARATVSPIGGPAAYAAEVLGTLILVLFIILAVSLTADPPAGFGFADYSVIGLVHMFALTLVVAALGGASGGHFNPAVTLALLVKRKITPPDAGVYIVCQLVGAVLAALIVRAVVTDAATATDVGSPSFDTVFIDGAAGKAMIAEFIGAFVLMFAIMAAAVNPRASRTAAPWIIGLALGLAAFAIAPLTGAGFNPARAFGPALVGGGFGTAWEFLLVYVLAPVLGAVAAALAYTAIVLDPQARLEQRPIDKLD